ncbi:MAG: TlpA disulfide reductase family protein [Candidatus Endonucleobacter bathymodioli]|uniref:TlpA disulfide reductase family protein n=1 Tax=Candidatus Endonucleibacter bathymodioli TaxID=539814 RepID=A0AA90NJ63_9GAMM|nr:TlpA disulfide reductase family protein [Candidatus Endonucleobacter bathymodioli]
MNSTIRVTLFFTLLSLFVVACQRPDFQATDGKAINLKDNSGRWLIINVWAEWCGPCRAEVPELNALSSAGDIRVVGHDFDGVQGQPLLNKVKKMGINFPIIAENPLPLLSSGSPKALPATYIINDEGKLVDTLYGSQTNEGLSLHVKKLQQKTKSHG